MSPTNASKPAGLETIDFKNGADREQAGADRNSRQYANLIPKKSEKQQVSPNDSGASGMM